MLSAFLAAVLLGVSEAKPPTAPHRILIRSGDGWAISAIFTEPAQDKAVAILIHGAGSSKNEWAAFALRLKNRGIGSVAIDLRGHGQSTVGPKGKRTFKQFSQLDWIESVRDVEATAGFLRQRGIPGSRTVIVGASVGANIAAMAAPLIDARALVLLSPGLNYLGLLLPTSYGDLPVLTAAAKSDPVAWRASVLLKKQGVVFLRASGGHGVAMFRDASLMGKVIRWIVVHAKPPLAPPQAPKAG